MSEQPTPAPAVVKTAAAPRKDPGWLMRLIGFAGWILSGFGLFGSRRKRNHQEEIIVYSVHQSFFLWAMILCGFIGGALVRQFPGLEVICGWIYLWIILYTLISFIYDVNTTKFMLWIGIFCFIWLGAAYMQNLKHIPVLSQVLQYFHNLRPQFDPGFALAISWLLLPPWVGSLFHTFSQGRKTFTPNSIEEIHMGHGNEIIDRSGLKFRRRYRDLFETLLGLGACDLEAIDGNGNVTKRWENILFLAFTWKQLDEILHQRATVFEAPEEEKNDTPSA